MKVLIFDTETTGLVPKNASFYATSEWPYIIQLSYILFNVKTQKILKYKDSIIKLDESIEISKESTDVHGITRELSNERGEDIKNVLKDLQDSMKEAELIVAHNISFDKRILIVESIRNKMRSGFIVDGKHKPEYCSMKSSIDICKIERVGNNGEKYYKFPTLLELHQYLFKDEKAPNNLHNSMVDVLICLRCFCKLKYNYDTRSIGCRTYRTLCKEFKLKK